MNTIEIDKTCNALPPGNGWPDPVIARRAV